MTCGIYKITNKTNNKIYIGQSVKINMRWNNHISNAFNLSSNEYDSYLHRAFRKDGIEQFSFEIIEECNVDDLNTREIYWIDYYNSTDPSLGYNATIGGSASTGVSLTLSQVNEISMLLSNTDLINRDIALRYNVSENIISGINTGYYWKRNIEYPIRKRKRKIKTNVYHCIDCGDIISSQGTRCVSCAGKAKRLIERPNPEELIKLVATKGFSSVGREYGVSDNAIRKWLKSYGLPTSIQEVKEYYKNL